MKDATLITLGGTGAVLAALCCAVPVVGGLLGIGALAALAPSLEAAALPLMAGAVGLMSLGLYLKAHKRGDTENACCSSSTQQQTETKIMTTEQHNCCPTKTDETDISAGALKANGSYDLAVIGAGSAGFSAAITAAEQGAQVALIGHGTIGGTCVNVGCVPSKTMIRASETLHQAVAAQRFDGIEASAQVTDWAALVAQKQDLVDQLRQAKYIDLLPSYNGVAYLQGQAQLVSGGVKVGEDVIKAQKTIIATGTSPAVPPIDGIDEIPFLTSTEALELKVQPRSIIVLGGGYIGCELAQMFARAGTKVTIVFRSRLVPEAEPEISAALAQYFTVEGIDLRRVEAYESVSKTGEGIALDVRVDGEPESLQSEHLLITAGRKANTDGLGLAEIGVEVLPNGGIKVNDQMQTSREGVYAVGDVTGRDQFVYMAAYGAKIAAKNALNGNTLTYDNGAMPAVVFTDPQVASVGLTQAQAETRGIAVKTSVIGLEHVPRALATRDVHGLIKLVAAEDTGRA